MLTSEIDLAVAEVTGKSDFKRKTRTGKDDPAGVVLYYKECLGGGAYTWTRVPLYHKDLNAMHEAEKMLSPDELNRYVLCLSLDVIEAYADAVCATCAQRAEAFLRTLNLWVK